MGAWSGSESSAAREGEASFMRRCQGIPKCSLPPGKMARPASVGSASGLSRWSCWKLCRLTPLAKNLEPVSWSLQPQVSNLSLLVPEGGRHFSG